MAARNGDPRMQPATLRGSNRNGVAVSRERERGHSVCVTQTLIRHPILELDLIEARMRAPPCPFESRKRCVMDVLQNAIGKNLKREF